MSNGSLQLQSIKIQSMYKIDIQLEYILWVIGAANQWNESSYVTLKARSLPWPRRLRFSSLQPSERTDLLTM